LEGLAIHPLTDDVIATGQETHSWALAGRPPAWELVGTPQASVFLGTDDFFTATGVPLRLEEPGRWDDRVAPLPAGFNGRFHATSSAQHGVIGIYGSRSRKIFGAEYLLARATDGGLSLTPGKLLGRTPVTIRLRLSPDGKLLAACDDYQSLSLHETATGNLVSKGNPAADLVLLTAYGWLTSNRLIGLGGSRPRGEAGNEERVVLWEAPSGRVLHQLVNASAMDCLAVLPGGTQFAEAGVDKRVRIRDATTLKVLREFRAHDGPITVVAAHPTQPLLATASADLTIRIWNLADGKMLEELPPSVAVPLTLQFSPSGNRLASVDQRGKVRIWDFSQHAPGIPQPAAK
jgi:WD40 repeat protein